jgi:hypothetical protein
MFRVFPPYTPLVVPYREPSPPLFGVIPLSDIFLCYKFGVGFITRTTPFFLQRLLCDYPVAGLGAIDELRCPVIAFKGG